MNYYQHVYPYLYNMCSHTKLFWLFLNEHIAFGQEDTHNSVNNCAAFITLTNNSDRFVEITTFNEKVKIKNSRYKCVLIVMKIRTVHSHPLLLTLLILMRVSQYRNG